MGQQADIGRAGVGRDVGVGFQRREDGGGREPFLSAHRQGFEQGGRLRAAFADRVLPGTVPPEPERGPFARVVELAPLIDRRALGVGDIGGELIE